MVELARLEVAARWEGVPPTRHVGRAINSWLYRSLAQLDEGLVDRLHDAPGTRPFSLALVPSRASPAEATLVLGVGPTLSHLMGDLVERMMREGRLLLDGHLLSLERVVLCRTETFESLLRRWLFASKRAVPVRMTFLAPTTFHSRGRILPLPLPELVFGGLLERWHDWGGTGLGPGAPATIEVSAAVRRHRLRSVPVAMEGRFTAFVGEAEFTLVRPDPAYAGLLALLGSFAEFAGIGQKVAMGMGCVRVTPLHRSPSDALARGA